MWKTNCTTLKPPNLPNWIFFSHMSRRKVLFHTSNHRSYWVSGSTMLINHSERHSNKFKIKNILLRPLTDFTFNCKSQSTVGILHEKYYFGLISKLEIYIFNQKVQHITYVCLFLLCNWRPSPCTESLNTYWMLKTNTIEMLKQIILMRKKTGGLKKVAVEWDL